MTEKLPEDILDETKEKPEDLGSKGTSPWKATGRIDAAMIRRRKTVDQKRLKELEEELRQVREELAYDVSTGLHNVRAEAGKKDLLSRLELLARNEEPFNIVYLSIDFDGLKPANSLYGSENADVLLRFFGETLKECCRDSDFPFREGHSGDEFGIVFFDVPLAEIPVKISEINDKFLESLETLDSDSRFSSQELPKNVVSFSAGVTALNKSTAVRPDGRKYFAYEKVFGSGGVRERAEGMYKLAKAAGGNRYVIDGDPKSHIIRKDFVVPKRDAFT